VIVAAAAVCAAAPSAFAYERAVPNIYEQKINITSYYSKKAN
jgi:hypothetical protein